MRTLGPAGPVKVCWTAPADRTTSQPNLASAAHSTPPSNNQPMSNMISKKAPAFTLPDQDGTIHRLADYKGKHVVLFFYPKDSTEGCTREACGFRDLASEFSRLGAVVFGISILNVKSKAKFAKKNSLNFPLLADEDHSVAESYGLWIEKSMYGKKYMGISRETFIVGPDGKIAAHWPKVVANEDHSLEILAWLEDHSM